MSSDQLFSLPFEEQVGQFFFIGLPGTEVDAEARELIEEIKPGGIILFGRNIETAEQVRKLLDDSRALVPTPLLCGIDQEGGLVDRLREIFPPMPSARALRQHGDLAGVRTLGRVTGELLRMLGLNINFAPVMSIITQERSQLTNGLYSRSFGSSPGEVLGYTTVYMRGLQGMGVLGCLKHFPGIGAGAVDSHIEMPVVPLSRDDLLAQDLAPYIELFQREDDRVRVVMVSHGGFPFIDIKKGTTGGLIEPASINSGIVTKLLRQELGYNHLVVTDDLEMGAIAKHCEIEEASVRAFAAGEDMLLICATPETIRRGYRALLKAAREQRISERRMQESLSRIADTKALMQPPTPLSIERFNQLAQEIKDLNKRLEYVYPGESNVQ
ncbi:MAG TPA: glycoside hydrolase family 3 N-terminal domain-containing protein [Pyrinomonadaceae bacterium]|jgi:beta-N-acetylhexosaminidase|nr:glycoside hydrolase family 3 N-terminal domain-containing protein [Pyrinomonadaceae bacterium]